MSAPYRDELAALEARYAALEAEVADRERARDEAARMLAEAKARARSEEVAADIRAGGPERRRRRVMMAGTTAAMLAVAVGAAVHVATRKSGRAERMEATLRQFERFTDEACACKDKACADEVMSRVTKWAEDMARQYRDEKPETNITERAAKIGQRFGECMTKVLTSAPTAEKPEP